MRHASILARCLWVTRCNHHVTVIPITSLTLTTVRNITGHMVPGRVVKRKVVKLSRDSTLAGLGVLAGRRRRRRCHALTFHCYNVLLKTPADPDGPSPAAIGGYWGPAVR